MHAHGCASAYHVRFSNSQSPPNLAIYIYIYRHRARAQRAAAENNSLQFVLFSPRTTSESQHCNVGISDESIELSYRNVSDTDNQPWMPLATFPLGGEYLDVCMYKYMYVSACGDVVVDKLASSASIIMYAIVLYVLRIPSLALPAPRRQPVIAN